MTKTTFFSVVIQMPQDPEKKNKLFQELGVDKTIFGGKVIAAMIGDAIADLEHLKKIKLDASGID